MKMYLLLVIFASAGVTAASHVVKRSDDVNPLQVVVSKLSQVRTVYIKYTQCIIPEFSEIPQ